MLYIIYSCSIGNTIPYARYVGGKAGQFDLIMDLATLGRVVALIPLIRPSNSSTTSLTRCLFAFHSTSSFLHSYWDDNC